MSQPGELALFSLDANPEYARRVASYLDISLAAHERRHFEDGEHKCRSLDDVFQFDVFVIHSLYGEPTCSVNDKLCELLFFVGSLKDAGAARVTAIAPYLCYARKDQRTQPHDPITTRYIAAMFEAVGVDRVITFDVHNISAYENAFRIPSEQLLARPLFVDFFRGIAQHADIAVVAPDFGAAKRAEHFRRDLAAIASREVSMALIEKYRQRGEVSGGALVGDVAGKTVIILDDLISSGTTLRRAAHICRDAGAAEVYAAATHGLFTAGANAMFGDSAFDGIVVTDTVAPMLIEQKWIGSRLHIVDSTALVAAAIQRAHRGDSA
jgi:ribose-phosphate pyrophosphokinase